MSIIFKNLLFIALVLVISSISLFADFDEQNIKKELPMLLGSSNQGQEFFLTFHPAWKNEKEGYGIKIYVASTEVATVKLEIPALNYEETILVMSRHRLTQLGGIYE